jgi:hypothetical protein
MNVSFLTLTRSRRAQWIVLVFCLFVGFALRFYTFDRRSLWMDEIHTFNDSRDNLKGQIKFYQERPSYLHPPLFFILTHTFYPFEKPERDLRIVPLIFGTLSIPMIFFLARSFSPTIALPVTLSLTFMAYHISLSQDGRDYSLLMFLGMMGIYFFLKYLNTLHRKYLLFVAASFSLSFYTSYISIPFIAFSQILWFYRTNHSHSPKKPTLPSFFLLNGLIFLMCVPWVLFLGLNYTHQPLNHPFHTETPGSFLTILYLVLNDWVPHIPLMVVAAILMVLFPIFSRSKKNALILLGIYLLPIEGLILISKSAGLTHFITSRYLIHFLPLFLICLFLSLHSLETKFEKLRKTLRLTPVFLVLFIASNLVILPLYYRAEKQDLRGLATYLKAHLRQGDKIFDGGMGYTPGILHYLGVYPEGRHQELYLSMDSQNQIQFQKPFIYRNTAFTIYHSKVCCNQYVSDGSRLWLVLDKNGAKQAQRNSHFAFKGYFDGSFLNFKKFPADGSLYLFLLDPSSPNEERIPLRIE